MVLRWVGDGECAAAQKSGIFGGGEREGGGIGDWVRYLGRQLACYGVVESEGLVT